MIDYLSHGKTFSRIKSCNYGRLINYQLLNLHNYMTDLNISKNLMKEKEEKQNPY